jgi:tetratricopeptide (TPR) repeat protein
MTQHKARRDRGRILTDKGWKKIYDAIKEKFPDGHTFQAISDLTDPAIHQESVYSVSCDTVSNILNRRAGADKVRIESLFRAFGLNLDANDHASVKTQTVLMSNSDFVDAEGPIAHPSIPNQNFVGREKAIATNNRGFNCYMNGDLTQANKQFELALKINPYHAASYYNQAWSYEQVGDFDRAIELYRQAAFHGLAAAYCNLARLHIIEQKNYDLAVDICQRGLTLVQEDTVETDKIVKAALFIYLAWAWIDRGRDEEALERLQEAIELEGDRALTHALKAQALDNLGQSTEALEAWKNYINKYPKCNCRDKEVWMGKARQRIKESS